MVNLSNGELGTGSISWRNGSQIDDAPRGLLLFDSSIGDVP
jgi:hypothetical protein